MNEEAGKGMFKSLTIPPLQPEQARTPWGVDRKATVREVLQNALGHSSSSQGRSHVPVMWLQSSDRATVSTEYASCLKLWEKCSS